MNGISRWAIGLHLPQGAVSQMALAVPGDHQWRIAAQTPAGISLLTFAGQKRVDLIVFPGEQADLMRLSPDGTLLYTSAGRLLRVWQITPQGAQLRETQTLTQQPRSLQLLAGGRSTDSGCAWHSAVVCHYRRPRATAAADSHLHAQRGCARHRA